MVTLAWVALVTLAAWVILEMVTKAMGSATPAQATKATPPQTETLEELEAEVVAVIVADREMVVALEATEAALAQLGAGVAHTVVEARAVELVAAVRKARVARIRAHKALEVLERMEGA